MKRLFKKGKSRSSAKSTASAEAADVAETESLEAELTEDEALDKLHAMVDTIQLISGPEAAKILGSKSASDAAQLLLLMGSEKRSAVIAAMTDERKLEIAAAIERDTAEELGLVTKSCVEDAKAPCEDEGSCPPFQNTSCEDQDIREIPGGTCQHAHVSCVAVPSHGLKVESETQHTDSESIFDKHVVSVHGTHCASSGPSPGAMSNEGSIAQDPAQVSSEEQAAAREQAEDQEWLAKEHCNSHKQEAIQSESFGATMVSSEDPVSALSEIQSSADESVKEEEFCVKTTYNTAEEQRGSYERVKEEELRSRMPSDIPKGCMAESGGHAPDLVDSKKGLPSEESATTTSAKSEPDELRVDAGLVIGQSSWRQGAGRQIVEMDASTWSDEEDQFGGQAAHNSNIVWHKGFMESQSALEAAKILESQRPADAVRLAMGMPTQKRFAAFVCMSDVSRRALANVMPHDQAVAAGLIEPEYLDDDDISSAAELHDSHESVSSQSNDKGWSSWATRKAHGVRQKTSEWGGPALPRRMSHLTGRAAGTAGQVRQGLAQAMPSKVAEYGERAYGAAGSAAGLARAKSTDLSHSVANVAEKAVPVRVAEIRGRAFDVAGKSAGAARARTAELSSSVAQSLCHVAVTAGTKVQETGRKARETSAACKISATDAKVKAADAAKASMSQVSRGIAGLIHKR